LKQKKWDEFFANSKQRGLPRVGGLSLKNVSKRVEEYDSLTTLEKNSCGRGPPEKSLGI